MVRAVWNGEVIAEGDDTVMMDGNHYFLVESVRADLLRPSSTTTVCPWKGRASYHTIAVNGKENHDAAWFYPSPSAAASSIAGRMAFWHGVKIEDDGGPTARRTFRDRFRKADSDPAGGPDHVHSGPAPVSDLTDATFFASLDGHATIVDFWAPWCGPCKALHPIFDDLARQHGDDRISFARVNVDENPGVAAGLGIMSIPTLVLCDAHGNEIDRIVGLPDRRKLEQLVAHAAQVATVGRRAT